MTDIPYGKVKARSDADAIPAIDLHGFCPDEAEAKVSETLESEEIGELVGEVKVFGIIHGLGNGVLKALVTRILQKKKRERQVLDYCWFDNPGEVIVMLPNQKQ